LFLPGVIAAVVFVASAGGFLFYDNSHAYREVLAEANPKMAAMVSDTEGWIPGDDHLKLARGTAAFITYDFYKAADHQVSLDVRTNAAPELSVVVSLHVQNRHIDVATLYGGDMQKVDLTPFLKDHYGVFRVRFDASLAATAPVPSCYPLKAFTLTLERPRSIHVLALLFFALLAGLLYGAIVAVTIRAIRTLGATFAPDDTQRKTETSTAKRSALGFLKSPLALILTIALGLLLIASSKREEEERPEGGTKALVETNAAGPHSNTPAPKPLLLWVWWHQKKFDDVRAISNAAALLDSGFDVDALYFRGRTRPGFIAWACPLVRLHPQTILRVQKTPADFYSKVWEEYDRDDASYAKWFQLALSMYALALAGVSLVLIAAIGLHLGLHRAAVPLAVLAAACFFRRALDIPITQTFVFFINLCAVTAWLQWLEWERAGAWGRGSWLALAAFLMGLAILTKTSTVTSIVPIVLYQIVLLCAPGRPSSDRRADATRFLLYWLIAGVVVIVWFQGFLGGAFTEYGQFWKEHAAAQSSQEYEATSIAGIIGAFRNVFGIGGLVLVAAGLVGAVVRRWRVHVFVWFWILGAAAVFAMPYIFPRFFQYFIPALAFLAAEAVAGALEFLRDAGRAVSGPGGPNGHNGEHGPGD